MEIFSLLSKYGHERVVFCLEERSHLRAIIAIHSTRLGPALGGVRMWPYPSEEEALEDSLRLSRGMTYKAAAAGLELGGGKAVVIADPNVGKSEALWRAFGKYVELLGGRYITAEDVGTDVQDMEQIRAETTYVVGTGKERGGSGDPSPMTALGVFAGIKACLELVYGVSQLKGRRVAIQGVGKVGRCLAELLCREGVELFVCDMNAERVNDAVKSLGAKAVGEPDFFSLPVDVISPCALGGVLNDDTIPRIRAPIVAGSANNQLKDEARHSQDLMKRSILYAPDYVINAGGLINVYSEIENTSPLVAQKRVLEIGETIQQVVEMAQRETVSTLEAANRLAERRLAMAEA